ncbi:MAG: DNA-formamidopyrimidine glycosylase family protein, partial [Sediminispirochaetaceae bacterium]
MPELPEVQTVIDDLTAAGLPGRRILSVDVRRPGIVRPLSPDGFVCNVSGLTFGAISRHGKFIHFSLSGGISILAHLRMTGQFALTAVDEPDDPHDRVVFSLDDGSILRFHDTRTFGRLICTSHPEEILGRLGPDALTSPLTGEQFHGMLQSRRRQIKALLLDQNFIAGLGNIYCDEALFAAGIHPLRSSGSIDQNEAARLLDAVHSV